MNGTLTYVYCLVRKARRPTMRGISARMPGGGDVRVLDAGSLPAPRGAERLWVIVSSVRARDYSEAALARGLRDLDWVSRRAVAHEAVVEHFLSAPAVLPMQLLTLFTSDERVLADVVRARRRIERILTRIGRKLEWGLRLTWDEQAAREAVRRKQEAPPSGRAAAGDCVRGPAAGTAYLARKRDLLGAGRRQLIAARVEADRLYRAMARAASEARRRTATEKAAPGSRLLLDAAFLVPAARTRAFRAALRQRARQLDASGVTVSLTGPWPPYNFVEPRRA